MSVLDLNALVCAPDDSEESAFEDSFFDRIYPEPIREMSPWLWTPLAVARRAAELLVSSADTRVLDIGAGVGKFCLVGAILRGAHFSGVEQRAEFVRIARLSVARESAKRVEIIHGDVTSLSFQDYDAFYLFNPFEEHLYVNKKIDLSPSGGLASYCRCVNYVAVQLAAAPIGTRVVTYLGRDHEIPRCYQQCACEFGRSLKLWIKTRRPQFGEGTWGSASD